MIRTVSAVVWGLHAVVWIGFGGNAMAISGPAAGLIAFYVVARIAAGRWSTLDLPISASVIILAGPARSLLLTAFTASIGVLAIGTSFLLFAAGTMAALTRQRWHRQ